jgi:hypothetical protein
LGIHAYFVDTDWNPLTMLLGLQPFHGKQHNGSEIANIVAYMLKFFKIEKRWVCFLSVLRPLAVLSFGMHCEIKKVT